jgi:hypothetical protein
VEAQERPAKVKMLAEVTETSAEAPENFEVAQMSLGKGFGGL